MNTFANSKLLFVPLLFLAVITVGCGERQIDTMEEYLEAMSEAVTKEKGTCDYAFTQRAQRTWVKNGTQAVISFQAKPGKQFGYGSTNEFADSTKPLMRVQPKNSGLTDGAVYATWTEGFGINVNQFANGQPNDGGACGAGTLANFACDLVTAWGLVVFNPDGSPAKCDPDSLIFDTFLVVADAKLMLPDGIQPATWAAQFEQMNETFGAVFGDKNYCDGVVCSEDPSKPWYKCPALVETANTYWYNNDPKKPDSWAGAYNHDKDRPTFSQVAAGLFGNALETPEAALNTLTDISVEDFGGLGDTLCTDPLAVRTYLWVIMDSNAKNFGNGHNPDCPGSDDEECDQFAAGNQYLPPELEGNEGWLRLDLNNSES